MCCVPLTLRRFVFDRGMYCTCLLQQFSFRYFFCFHLVTLWPQCNHNMTTLWPQCRKSRFFYVNILNIIHFILHIHHRLLWYSADTGVLFVCRTCRFILCLWFCASLIYINNFPMRCNTKQSVYYSARSLYMLQCQPHPSSGLYKTITAESGTGHIFCAAATWPSWPRWREVASQKIWPVPEAVVTVLCTPGDGCCWHPKHGEWTWLQIYK